MTDVNRAAITHESLIYGEMTSCPGLSDAYCSSIGHCNFWAMI